MNESSTRSAVAQILEPAALFSIGFAFDLLVAIVTKIASMVQSVSHVSSDRIGETYVLIYRYNADAFGVSLLGFLALAYVWWPHLKRRTPSSRLGRIHFFVTFTAYNIFIGARFLSYLCMRYAEKREAGCNEVALAHAERGALVAIVTAQFFFVALLTMSFIKPRTASQ